jgi:acyl-CoA reductase-like NAD-dependent aldehyde dehydrogenase
MDQPLPTLIRARFLGAHALHSRCGEPDAAALPLQVMRYIEEGKAAGAKVLVGGSRPDGFDKGYFVQPTIFVDVTPEMAVWKEEIFGPVLAVRTFATEEQAVREANDTTFGLGTSLCAVEAAV